jgi:hypothetical protein
VWLLEPASSADRLSRHFRKVLDDIRNEEQVRDLMHQPGLRSETDWLASVRALAIAAGLTDTAVEARPTYWEIVKTVSESGPANGVIEVMWKVCSDHAHGDSWPTLSASQRSEVAGAAPKSVATFKIEANIGLLAEVTMMAVKVTGWDGNSTTSDARPVNGKTKTSTMPSAVPKTRKLSATSMAIIPLSSCVTLQISFGRGGPAPTSLPGRPRQ